MFFRALNGCVPRVFEFNALTDIPPELEWLANITNPEPRSAYEVDVAEFLAFSGLIDIKSLRAVDLDPGSIYRNILRKYGRETGVNAEVNGLYLHSLRATAARNALSNEADIAKVQEWLATLTFRRLGSTTGARPGRRTARHFIEVLSVDPTKTIADEDRTF